MLKTRWQIQEAKSRLSELVDQAVSSGPQIITRRGVDTVVVMAAAEYDKLRQPEKHFADFFLESPLRGVQLDLERDRGAGREVVL